MIADAHCHFFSERFFRLLGKGLVSETDDAAVLLPRQLGWDPPGPNASLADRWMSALDSAGVSRAVLIASLPGDEESVAEAVTRQPNRFTGAFMVNAASPDAPERTTRAFAEQGLSMVCLFPAMHHVAIDDARSIAIVETARAHRRAIFVHCGMLSVGVRGRLGLPSPFDLRLGDPLAVASVATRFPDVPFVIPHFGAGLFREALMAAKAAPNILIDTSSSNSWTSFHHAMTLKDVFARALDVVGVKRLLFGTDSSFFPRGWQTSVYESQVGVMTDLGLTSEERQAILHGNFERVFSSEDK